MGERTEYAPGTFCWADLQTGDQQAAKAFYRSLLSWELEDTPMGDDAVYTMASVGGRRVAAIAPLMGHGMPPHWNCYVAVEDADAAAARARDAGATVVAEPFDVFDAGRMAMIQDPQGAFLALWQAGRSIGAQLVNAPGAMSFNDLATPDPAASAAFYGELFGWRAEEIPESGGRYWSIFNGDRLNGGLMPAPPGQPPSWNVYFAVDDLDAALARVADAGGAVVFEPMEVPAGRFAFVQDPQGAAFAVFTGTLDP
jgi:predicted enzyme related to lactoylglutathione lyase